MKTFLKDLILPSFWLLFFVIFSKNDDNLKNDQKKPESLVAKNHEATNFQTNSSLFKRNIKTVNFHAK